MPDTTLRTMRPYRHYHSDKAAVKREQRRACGNAHTRHIAHFHRPGNRACLQGSAGLLARTHRRPQRMPGYPAWPSSRPATRWLAPALLPWLALLAFLLVVNLELERQVAHMRGQVPNGRVRRLPQEH